MFIILQGRLWCTLFHPAPLLSYIFFIYYLNIWTTLDLDIFYFSVLVIKSEGGARRRIRPSVRRDNILVVNKLETRIIVPGPSRLIPILPARCWYGLQASLGSTEQGKVVSYILIYHPLSKSYNDQH